MEPMFLSKEKMFDIFVDVAGSVIDSHASHPEDMATYIATHIDGAAATLVALRAQGFVRWDQ